MEKLDAFSLKLHNHIRDLKIEPPGTSFLNPYWNFKEDFSDAYSQISMKIKEFDTEKLEDNKPKFKIGKQKEQEEKVEVEPKVFRYIEL